MELTFEIFSCMTLQKVLKSSVLVFRIFFIFYEHSSLPAILFLSAVTTSVEHVTRTVRDEEIAVFGMNAM